MSNRTYRLSLSEQRRNQWRRQEKMASRVFEFLVKCFVFFAILGLGLLTSD